MFCGARAFQKVKRNFALPQKYFLSGMNLSVVLPDQQTASGFCWMTFPNGEHLLPDSPRETRCILRLAIVPPALSFPARLQRDPQKLETQLGPESNPPVVVGSVHENDFIAGLKTESDRAKKSLDSSSRVKGRIHIIGSKIAHVAGKRGERSGGGIKAEIGVPALHGHEEAHQSGGLKLWTEQAVENPNIGIRRGDRPTRSICEALGEHFIEIVRHFRFDLYVFDHVDGGPAAQPHKIGARLAQPEIIDECADFRVVLSAHHGCETQSGNQN